MCTVVQINIALINAFILLAVLRRVKVPGPSPVLQKKEEVAVPLKMNKLEMNIARDV